MPFVSTPAVTKALTVDGSGLGYVTVDDVTGFYPGAEVVLHKDDWVLKTPDNSPPATLYPLSATLGSEVLLWDGGTAQTWTWDGTDWTQLAPAASPPIGPYGSMVAFDGQVFLFGGFFGGAPLQRFWVWDGVTWAQPSPAHLPPARYGAGMTVVDGKIVLFGGIGVGFVKINDTWTWDGVDWTQESPATSPTARNGFAIGTLGSKGYLFGGFTSTYPMNDTWAWDGTTWEELSPETSPSVRGNLYFPDSLNGSLLLVDGYTGPPAAISADTWAWDGINWRQLDLLTYPLHQAGGGLARNAISILGSSVVVFGGGNLVYTPTARTWVWNGVEDEDGRYIIVNVDATNERLYLKRASINYGYSDLSSWTVEENSVIDQVRQLVNVQMSRGGRGVQKLKRP